MHEYYNVRKEKSEAIVFRLGNQSLEEISLPPKHRAKEVELINEQLFIYRNRVSECANFRLSSAEIILISTVNLPSFII